MFIVEKYVDGLLTVLAVTFDVALSVVKADLVQDTVGEVTVRLWAFGRILWMGCKVKHNSFRSAINPIARLAMLLNGRIRTGFSALVTHLLEGVLDPMVVPQVEIVGPLLPEKRSGRLRLATFVFFKHLIQYCDSFSTLQCRSVFC